VTLSRNIAYYFRIPLFFQYDESLLRNTVHWHGNSDVL